MKSDLIREYYLNCAEIQFKIRKVYQQMSNNLFTIIRTENNFLHNFSDGINQKIYIIYDVIICWGDAMLWQLPGAHKTQAVQETIRKEFVEILPESERHRKGTTIPFLDNSHRHRDSPWGKLLTYSPFHWAYAFVWTVKGWCHINYSKRNRKILLDTFDRYASDFPTFWLFVCNYGKVFPPPKQKWNRRQSMSLKVIDQV